MKTAWIVALLAAGASAAPVYRGGVVAAAHPVGAQAGKDMLDRGGNAVDAAVAAAFTMAVVGPYHSGLGGGGFAVVHGAAWGDQALDFREVAPLAATREMYLRDGGFVPTLATDGALAVAVPGAIAGYLALHAKFGKLPRAVVLAPALRAAKDGLVISPKYRDLAAGRVGCLAKDEDARRIFLSASDGGWAPPSLGTLLRQPELARTLEALAKQGPGAFYGGPVGKQLVADLQKKGGLLTLEDLTRYQPRWRTPLEGQYRGHRVITMPPPSAGGVTLLEVLGVLEAHGAKGLPSREPDVLHVFIEALRRSFHERALFLGDPSAMSLDAGVLTTAAHARAVLEGIDRTKATRSSAVRPAADLGVEPKNTTHISVVDAAGDAVALTTTINYYFGSCVVAKGTGILLNDEMDDFTPAPGVANVFGLVQSEANAIAPGKTPVSSMTPTIVFQKDDATKVRLVVGSPGGSTIPTTVLQVVSNVLDGNLDVVRAVGAGRLHHQYLPDQVMVDKTALDPLTAAALEKLGHTLSRVEGWGDAEAVAVDPLTGLRSAASDPRNEGLPAGQP